MEHKVSHGSTRKSATNPRTSSTREWRKMRDNTLGEPHFEKRGSWKRPIWWKEASCLKGIPSPTVLNALQQPY